MACILQKSRVFFLRKGKKTKALPVSASLTRNSFKFQHHYRGLFGVCQECWGIFLQKRAKKCIIEKKYLQKGVKKVVCPLYKLTKTVYNDILNIPITKELVAVKRQEVTEIYGSHP